MAKFNHYPDSSPPPVEKIVAQNEIDRHKAEFFSKGGRIEQIPAGTTSYNKDGTIRK